VAVQIHPAPPGDGAQEGGGRMGKARPGGRRPGLLATPCGVARWDGASGRKRLPIGQARQGPRVHEPYAELLRPQLSNPAGCELHRTQRQPVHWWFSWTLSQGASTPPCPKDSGAASGMVHRPPCVCTKPADHFCFCRCLPWICNGPPRLQKLPPFRPLAIYKPLVTFTHSSLHWGGSTQALKIAAVQSSLRVLSFRFLRKIW
jgi:hypothetical protein